MVFNFNDRNLVIVAITVLVLTYIVLGKNPNNVGDIIEKAIIALGSLATGSILGGVKKVPKIEPPKNKGTGQDETHEFRNPQMKKEPV